MDQIYCKFAKCCIFPFHSAPFLSAAPLVSWRMFKVIPWMEEVPCWAGRASIGSGWDQGQIQPCPHLMSTCVTSQQRSGLTSPGSTFPSASSSCRLSQGLYSLPSASNSFAFTQSTTGGVEDATNSLLNDLLCLQDGCVHLCKHAWLWAPLSLGNGLTFNCWKGVAANVCCM